MDTSITRRRFAYTAAAGAAMLGMPQSIRAARKSPRDYVIIEGHRDIWEFNDRFAVRNKSQSAPLRDHLLPRLLEGGVSATTIPAGGDAPNHRANNIRRLEGSLQVLDMLLVEIDKSNGKAGVIRTKADVPTKPNPNKVMFFLDIEGGSSIEVDPETYLPSERRLALLRAFYRQGVRGMQLTHDGRNQLADGQLEGKPGNRLSRFGVEVVQEMNRLGMMIGVAHLSMNALLHVAEITKQPIVSTHTNIEPYYDSHRAHGPEEVKAIVSTGGVIGIRYHSNKSTPYPQLADSILHMIKVAGIDHTACGWMGHDIGHPRTGVVPGVTKEEFKPEGVEAQTMNQHWSNFIGLLEERGLTDEQIAKVLGGNWARVWSQILKE